MQQLTIATWAVPAPMGQQVYEQEIGRRAAAALGRDVTVAHSVARTVRSSLPGTARVPHRVLYGRSPALRRAVGAVMYRGADVVHRTQLVLPPARVPEIVTIHDTVSWHFPDEAPPPPLAAEEARRARAVITVSAYSAQDLSELLGIERVHVVPNGVDDRFFDAAPLDRSELRALGIDGPYVLHAGGSTLRKNLEGLAAAWPAVRAAFPDVSLVLSGPPTSRRNSLFGNLAGAVRVGRVPSKVLPGLMAAAQVVVVPSLVEGFGLPALEAMAVGTPVVAAARSSLPEVCGDAAVLVEPDGPALAEGIVHALGGSEEVRAGVDRGLLRAREYTWERAAAEHARVWRKVLAET